MDTDERKLKNIVTSLNEALTADKDDQSNGVAMCDVRIAGVGTDVPKDTEGAGIVRLQVYGQGQRDALIKNAQKIPGIQIMEDNAETLAQLQQFAELCRRDETAQSFLGPPPAYKARSRGRGKGKWAKGAPKGEVQRAREMSGSGSLSSGAGPSNAPQRRVPLDPDIKAVINSFEGTLTTLTAQMLKMQEQQSRVMDYLFAGTQQAHTPIRYAGAAAAIAAASPAGPLPMTSTSVAWITANSLAGSLIINGFSRIPPPGRSVRMAYMWALFCLMFVAFVGIPRKAL